MTTRPPSTELPVVAWLGEPAPAELPGVRLVSAPSLEALAAMPELPMAVVLREGVNGWSLDECLAQAALPALSTIPAVVVAAAWSEALVWRGAQAGAFCCLSTEVTLCGLTAALQAAAREALQRRRRLGAVSAAGRCLVSARFCFRTLDEAEAVAALLAATLPGPERRLGGLLELLVNAVEHGNLGIGFDEKRALVRAGSLHDELGRRLGEAPWAARRVTATLEPQAGAARVTIEDEGEGFDYEAVLSRTPDLTAPHGRGIFLARAMSFDRLRYEGRGNRVIAEVDVP